MSIAFPIRVGAVSYLNTRPLIAGLRERLGENGSLALNLPSRLAEDLRCEKLDVALIPSIEYLAGVERGYRVLSNAAIACRGPVWSVRLLSRVPIAQIKRVALDEGSRTSAALTKILLWEVHGLRPETTPLGMEQDPEALDVDAILMIGDRAMHPPTDLYHEIWDLGERWCDWTGLPFVFAMWVTRSEAFKTEAFRRAFEASRDEGLSRAEEIAANEAGSHGLTKEEVVRYFRQHLHFTLGPRELDGLELFRRKAAKLGLFASTATTQTALGAT